VPHRTSNGGPSVNTSMLDHRGSSNGPSRAAGPRRAHARTGAVVRIARSCVTGVASDDALVEFAGRYAGQSERDHAVLEQAARSGTIGALTDV